MDIQYIIYEADQGEFFWRCTSMDHAEAVGPFKSAGAAAKDLAEQLVAEL